MGHGIGREMHEDPQVPNFVSSQLRRGHGDFRLAPGLVIAVEPMVNMGTKRVRTRADHWTQVTADGRPSAHFEHTVAITENGPWVLDGRARTGRHGRKLPSAHRERVGVRGSTDAVILHPDPAQEGVSGDAQFGPIGIFLPAALVRLGGRRLY